MACSETITNRYSPAMTKPTPIPTDPAELKDLALAVLQNDRFPVYVANLRAYHKTQEIAENPKVELCYLDKNHHQVRITGVARVEQDRNLLQQIWDENPLLRNYLGSIDNPDLIVYRVDPQSVRYMREWALEYHDVSWT